MILTEKGSTRGTVSILLMAALIFLGTRFLVGYIEENFPPAAASTIEWKPVPDLLAKNEKALDEETAVELTDSEVDDKNLDAETGLQPENSTGGSRAAKKTKKRFAVERLFPDNVDQKPLFLFFADEGSILSQRMQRRTLSIPHIRNRINNEFYPVKINFDKPLTKTEYKLYNQYASAAAPAIAIRSASGESLAYNVGYLSGIKTVVLLQNAKNVQKRIDEGEEPESDL
jgi:hypothetical protein